MYILPAISAATEIYEPSFSHATTWVLEESIFTIHDLQHFSTFSDPHLQEFLFALIIFYL